MVASVSHNNHICFSNTVSGEYLVKMGRCSRTPLSFKYEAIHAAKLIKQKAGSKDIWLSYSGGIDSEFIVNTFIEAEVDFKIATAVMKGLVNNYDLEHSRKFCQQLGLNLVEIEIDIAEFFETELESYAINTQCVSPQFPVHMKLWNSLNGFIVAGHGDPIFKRVNNVWIFQIQEKEDSVYRYAEWQGRDMAPGFYAYTPELLLSFILEKEVSNLFITGKASKRNNIIDVKHNVYSKYYNLTKRDKKTGFEKINALDTYYRSKLESLMPQHNRKHLQTVDNLIEKLWPIQ